jgi:hypothetical protein
MILMRFCDNQQKIANLNNILVLENLKHAMRQTAVIRSNLKHAMRQTVL